MNRSKLDTASQYVNNLLLARGLLRTGKAIDFVRFSTAPSRGDGEPSSSTAPEALSAQVINLVHDLLLTRDRDQENYETLASSLRTLRRERSRDRAEIERLKESNQALRKEAIADEVSLRATTATTRSAEASLRTLRDEVVRAKTTISQIKSQSASDLRRRDLELARLKSHFATRQRGAKQVRSPSIVIHPGSASGTSTMTMSQDRECDLQNAAYSLRQESTEFLTELSRSLSEENDALIALARTTLDALRDLLVVSPSAAKEAGADQVIEHNSNQTSDVVLVQTMQNSYDVLEKDMKSALQSLKGLLTNPSFAPIEEVQAREDEIYRLREGWENMEARWNEAMHLMQGWKRRMMSGGDSINVEELRDGLKLGEGLETPSSRRNIDLDVSDTSPRGRLEPLLLHESEYGRTPADTMTTDTDILSHSKGHTHTSGAADIDLESREARSTLTCRSKAHNSHHNKATIGQNAAEVSGHNIRSAPNTNHCREHSVAAQTGSRVEDGRECRDRKEGVEVFEDVSDSGPVAAEKEVRLSVEDKLILAEREAQDMYNVTQEPDAILSLSNGLPESSKENWDSYEHKGRKRMGRKAGVSGLPGRRKSTLSPEELDALLAD